MLKAPIRLSVAILATVVVLVLGVVLGLVLGNTVFSHRATTASNSTQHVNPLPALR